MTEQEKTHIAGCVKGEKAAWDVFVRQYSNLVYHTIRKTLTLHHVESRDEVIEDLYQEFFISILQNNCRKLAQFRGDGGCTLASFLRVVASRQTIDFLRKQSPPVAQVSDDCPALHGEVPDTSITRETEGALAAALATLSPRDRLLIELQFKRGLPAEKVAAMLRTSVGAFYTQKSRILAKLRESLAKIPSS